MSTSDQARSTNAVSSSSTGPCHCCFDDTLLHLSKLAPLHTYNLMPFD